MMTKRKNKTRQCYSNNKIKKPQCKLVLLGKATAYRGCERAFDQ